MFPNNLKNSTDIEISIGEYYEYESGLYVLPIGYFNCHVRLLCSKYHDFDSETLEDFGCFLHQLNHEILHVIIARLEGYNVTVKLDDLRNFSSEVSHRFIPFF